MEDIKEVALLVAEEADDYIKANPLKSRDLFFASRLLAELQKDATPIGVVDESDDGLFADFETPNGVMVKRGDKLFLHPQPKAATVPQGWKPVPVQPTDAMVVAGLAGPSSDETTEADIERTYRAMLEAAPSLPADHSEQHLNMVPAAQSEGEQK